MGFKVGDLVQHRASGEVGVVQQDAEQYRTFVRRSFGARAAPEEPLDYVCPPPARPTPQRNPTKPVVLEPFRRASLPEIVDAVLADERFARARRRAAEEEKGGES